MILKIQIVLIVLLTFSNVGKAQLLENRSLLKKVELTNVHKPNRGEIVFQDIDSERPSIYEYEDSKIAIGYYRQNPNGTLSEFDTEQDYGLRLFLFDSNDSLLSKTNGASDTWKLLPTFYEIGDNKEMLILLERADEEYHGILVYILAENKMKYIGEITLYAYNEFESVPTVPIIDVYSLKNKSLEFVFNSEYLWEINEVDYSYNKVLASDYKYIYTNQIFTLEKTKTQP